MKQVMKYIPLALCVLCVAGMVVGWQQNNTAIWFIALCGWANTAYTELKKG